MCSTLARPYELRFPVYLTIARTNRYSHHRPVAERQAAPARHPGKIRAMIGYEAHTADALVFQLGITNNSDTAILVDPALFTSLSVGFDASVKDSAN